MGPVGGLTNVYHFNVNKDKEVTLDAIKKTNGDIKKIWTLLNGDLKPGYRLFNEAIKQNDAVALLYLAPALFAIKSGDDGHHNFSRILRRDLFSLLNSVYDDATGENSDRETKVKRSLEIFHTAAGDSTFSADFLATRLCAWDGRQNCYGLAVELRPFIGNGNEKLDCRFEKALTYGSAIGSPAFYEGLYLMNRSSAIEVKYPEVNQSFDSFKDEYMRSSEYIRSYERGYNDHEGFRFFGNSVVLAPSWEVWETFVGEKLTDVQFAPETSYFFERDLEQIKALVDRYQINITSELSAMNREETEGSEHLESVIKIWGNIEGSRTSIGELRVHSKSDFLEVHQTENSPEEIKPVIRFIENILQRTGSEESVRLWLSQISLW